MAETAPKHRSRLWAAGVSLVAVMPWLAMQAIPFLYFGSWTYGYAYGLYLIYFFVAGLCLAAVCAAEIFVRLRFFKDVRRFPWFTLLSAIGIVPLLAASEWAKPLVLLNPHWSLTHQSVVWDTSNGESFALVLGGYGNASNHKFTSAYLNWSGEQHAGIAEIDFDPLRFMWWVKGERVFADGSQNELRNRLAPSGLNDDELDVLTSDIWNVLEQAPNVLSVSSSNGTVEPLWVQPSGYQHVILGIVLWMIAMTLLFQIIGQLTLTQPARQHDRNDVLN